MAASRHILVVDDEHDLGELLLLSLRKAGYSATVALTGRGALESVASRRPDLIILDVMLPELSGTEVAGRLRTNPATASIPILMLTAKAEEMDQVIGLSLGADDYMTKPFSMRVLLARVEALLRRSGASGAADPAIVLGPVRIDPGTHAVTLDGEALRLTLTEFRILAALVQAGGRILSRPALISRAMGPGVMVTDRTIDVHVTSIRKRLGVHGGIIKTVRGVGYRATLDSEPPARV